LQAVGVATKPHRENRAKRLDQLAAVAKKMGLDGKWYSSRARGQRERITRVVDCQQTEVVRVACDECGCVKDEDARCRVWLLCVSCRGKIASLKRARFQRAREATLARAKRLGLLRAHRAGGRYMEKLLTLTLPHVEGHELERRIADLRAAWTYFLKSLNEALRERGVSSVEWLRAFENEQGSDGHGHPHFHLWMFAPWLDHSELRELWRAALQRIGFPIGADDALVVDLRAIRGKDGAAREIIKYLTKDVTSGGELVDPVWFARMYAALDGARTMQSSRGFIAQGDSDPVCPHCEAKGAFRVRVMTNPRANTRAESNTPASPPERAPPWLRRW